MNKKQLLNIYSHLSESDQKTLLDFATFLSQKKCDTKAEFPKPIVHERVEGETVIATIKRLKKSYFMLNMDSLLDETSTYMTQYMVQGRDIDDVINDLETSFEKHYLSQKEEFENA